ncbi:Uncharacterised protein [Serratia marcescens]|nr:Uncharacterised protein [Serratia marcescens]
MITASASSASVPYRHSSCQLASQAAFISALNWSSRCTSSADGCTTGVQNLTPKMLPVFSVSWVLNATWRRSPICCPRSTALFLMARACFTASSSCFLLLFSVLRCWATAGVSGSASATGGGPSTSSCAFSLSCSGCRSVASFSMLATRSSVASRNLLSWVSVVALETSCFMLSNCFCAAFSCVAGSGALSAAGSSWMAATAASGVSCKPNSNNNNSRNGRDFNIISTRIII